MAPRARALAAGQYLDAADFTALQGETGLAQTFGYREGRAYYDGQAGAALGAFVESGETAGQTICHLNGDPEGRYAMILAHRAEE